MLRTLRVSRLSHHGALRVLTPTAIASVHPAAAAPKVAGAVRHLSSSSSGNSSSKTAEPSTTGRALHTTALQSTSAHLTTAPQLAFGSDLVKDSIFAPNDTFTRRHVAPDDADIKTMLSTLGYESIGAFTDDVVPASIRISPETVSDDAGMNPLSESEMMRRATELSEDNEVFRSFIGMGYHSAVVPPVILRK